MESMEEPENRLLLQPWSLVCFAESTKLMAKIWFGDAGYALLLSDLSGMWYERADSELVQQRSKELNKRLTGHVSSFLNRLRGLMCPLLDGQQNSGTIFSSQRSPGMLTLRVRSELSGLPFYWDFHCPSAPVEMMSRHLVRPLMSMSLLLQGQVQKLATLLLQKDAEIEDYRESGAALSRERLRTEPFNEELFLQTFEAEALPQACCLEDGALFTSNLKHLYLAVTQQQARRTSKRNREASGDSEGPEDILPKDLASVAVDGPSEKEEGELQSAAAQPTQESVCLRWHHGVWFRLLFKSLTAVTRGAVLPITESSPARCQDQREKGQRVVWLTQVAVSRRPKCCCGLGQITFSLIICEGACGLFAQGVFERVESTLGRSIPSCGQRDPFQAAHKRPNLPSLRLSFRALKSAFCCL